MSENALSRLKRTPVNEWATKKGREFIPAFELLYLLTPDPQSLFYASGNVGLGYSPAAFTIGSIAVSHSIAWI